MSIVSAGRFTMDKFIRMIVLVFYEVSRFWSNLVHRRHRLHAKSFGDRAKPTIVLIHGIGASGDGWEPLVKLLEPYFHCVTIDLFGFGNSPKPLSAEYNCEQHLTLLRRALRRHHVAGPYIMLGHSLGALIAAKYARRHPEDIKQLILLSPPAYPPLRSIGNLYAVARTFLMTQASAFLRTSPCVTPAAAEILSTLGIVPETAGGEAWEPLRRSLKWCVEEQTLHEDVNLVPGRVSIIYGTDDRIVIGANVRAIARPRHIPVHTFPGGHRFTRAYAQVVSNWLLAYA